MQRHLEAWACACSRWRSANSRPVMDSWHTLVMLMQTPPFFLHINSRVMTTMPQPLPNTGTRLQTQTTFTQDVLVFSAQSDSLPKPSESSSPVPSSSSCRDIRINNIGAWCCMCNTDILYPNRKRDQQRYRRAEDTEKERSKPGSTQRIM